MKIISIFICLVVAEFEAIIRSCGMFKLYKNRYLSGVKKFETVTVSNVFSLTSSVIIERFWNWLCTKRRESKSIDTLERRLRSSVNVLERECESERNKVLNRFDACVCSCRLNSSLENYRETTGQLCALG